MLDSESLVYRIAFSSLRGINVMLANELLGRMGSEEAFFKASQQSLSSAMGFTNRIFDASYRTGLIERAKKESDFIMANNIKPLYFSDEAYPCRLLEANDAPILLYTLGNCDLNRGHFMAVVGTRHATPYGLDFVNRFVDSLSAKSAEPITVVSGLAFGIDAAAHAAALKNGLPTVGVLAHGLNTIYPAQHRSLAADMVRSQGLLVTEYMSQDAVHKGNFIARNRIVAALCDCTVVVESASKGGALITARLASGYDRDVFALPGRTSDRYSKGCNALIASQMAGLVEDADGLIDAMRWSRKSDEAQQLSLFPELSEDEQRVMAFLQDKGEAHISQLTMALNMSVARMMALMIDMEFKGLVLAYPGGKYRQA